MKIPKKLNVFGTVYKIKFVDSGGMFAGLCDMQKKTIYLDIHQSKEQMIGTYIHEAIHAMQFSLAFNQAISREMMEMMAENTAVLVMQMMKVK
jgi:hypothetical protein